MQDKYAGDIGDFGKFGMLRQVANTGLKIGVNWYRAYKPEEKNTHGNKTGYLKEDSFEGCDKELFNKLKEIVVSNNRSVAELEKANVVPNAEYYAEILKPKSDKSFSRDEWYKNSSEALSEADIIFCDPDNGLIVKSADNKIFDKFVIHDELVNYYLSGKSVIYYNCKKRYVNDSKFLNILDLEWRCERKKLTSSQWKVLRFKKENYKDAICYFICILQPDHFEKINSAIEGMMLSDWSRYFVEWEI